MNGLALESLNRIGPDSERRIRKERIQSLQSKTRDIEDRFRQQFIADLFADWLDNGVEAIEICRNQCPITYLKIVAAVCKEFKLEITHKDGNPPNAQSREEMLAYVEARAGERAGQIMRDLIAELDNPPASE